MDLLIDTHALIWFSDENRRLSAPARQAIIDPANRLHASAVTAWEFTDLRSRNRLPAVADFGVIAAALTLRLLDFPADLWRVAGDLPNIHGDPIDRMLVAHAMQTGMILITADAKMRSYPVRSLW